MKFDSLGGNYEEFSIDMKTSNRKFVHGGSKAATDYNISICCQRD